MINTEEYVFQVIEIVSSSNPIVFKGLVLQKIAIADKLTLSSAQANSVSLILTEIRLYGISVEEIERGMTAKLTLEADRVNFEVSPDSTRYLYLYRISF